MRYLPFILAAGFAAIAAPALAQQMQASQMPASMAGMTNPADTQYMAAMDRMNRAMATAPMSGNADRDFVAMMKPHHISAVEMARTELAYGKDPLLKKMARDIVASQNREIAEMRAWQASHPDTK